MRGKQGFWSPSGGGTVEKGGASAGDNGADRTSDQVLSGLPEIEDDVSFDDSKETTGVLRRLTPDDIKSQDRAAETSTEEVGSSSTDDGSAHGDSAYDGSAYDDSAYDGSVDGSAYDDSPYDEADDPTSNIPTWEGGMPNGEHRKAAGRKKRVWVVVLIIVLVLLVAGYGFGVYHFTGRILPGTRIGSLDISNLTPEQAVASLKNETDSYTCEIKLNELNAPIEGKAISLERDEEGMVNKALSQQSAIAWPLSLLPHPAMDVNQGVKYDQDALKAEVTKVIDGRNAQSLSSDSVFIEYDESQGLYVIKGSVSGTVADATVVYDATREKVDAFERTCEPDAKKALRSANIDDLPQFRYTVDWANRVRTNDIPILVNGEEKISSEASQNAEWVSVGNGPSVVVNQDAVREWAESKVADAVFYQENWINHMLDVDAFVSELSTRLATGVVDPIEAPMYEEMSPEGESRDKAYKRGTWDSSLGRYIDVDLESQFARLFDEKGEVIWESAIVSGDTSAGYSTVTGNFQIQSKQTNATLVGLDYNGDGAPDYSSNVSYWMPFYGGYGLHDATWRYTFGGETYSYDGSHGCVNLPYEKAGELFNLVSVGEQVYVHW